MKSTLNYVFVFLLGLTLGYFVNIFVTNRSYYDLLSENKELKFQIQDLKSGQSNPLSTETCSTPMPTKSPEELSSETAPQSKPADSKGVAPESVRTGH